MFSTNDTIMGIYMVAVLNCTCIFELYMAMLVVEDRYPNDKSYVLGIYAQNLDIILGSILNWEGKRDYLK